MTCIEILVKNHKGKESRQQFKSYVEALDAFHLFRKMFRRSSVYLMQDGMVMRKRDCFDEPKSILAR